MPTGVGRPPWVFLGRLNMSKWSRIPILAGPLIISIAAAMLGCDAEKAVDLAQLGELNSIDRLVVIGFGRLPNAPMPDPVSPDVDIAALPMDAPDGETHIPDIFRQGAPNQRLMAHRASEIDCAHRLKQAIRDLSSAENLTVAEYLGQIGVDDDQLHISGITHTGIRYRDDGIIELRAEMSMQDVVRILQRAVSQVGSPNTVR